VAHFPQVLRHVETGLAFHTDVEQGDVRPVLTRQQDGVIPVVGVDDLIARLRQPMGHHGQYQPVIVNDEDLSL
jgi:hypothetical protein